MLFLMEEIWKPVPDYEGLYEVSNLGRVRSLDRVVSHPSGTQIKKGKILKPSPANNNHFAVSLSKDGEEKTRTIERLVLETFAGKCPPGSI